MGNSEKMTTSNQINPVTLSFSFLAAGVPLLQVGTVARFKGDLITNESIMCYQPSDQIEWQKSIFSIN